MELIDTDSSNISSLLWRSIFLLAVASWIFASKIIFVVSWIVVPSVDVDDYYTHVTTWPLTQRTEPKSGHIIDIVLRLTRLVSWRQFGFISDPTTYVLFVEDCSRSWMDAYPY